jgi:hypothetical protein
LKRDRGKDKEKKEVTLLLTFLVTILNSLLVGTEFKYHENRTIQNKKENHIPSW